ncbi:MAM and LDL-receptor class A domain-containing protein 1-like [Hoplias malabaricus]|uniref:MAM and LDL-receptor class A domain-containing protein 1-like n=1 Tax=Hoplias malabaricus TaxID=27720 RepID=UPI003462F458
MSGYTQLGLLLAVAWLCVFSTESYASYPSITLPDWRPNADYFTRCDFDNDMSPFCDWTSNGVTRNFSKPGKFYLTGDPVRSGVAQLQSSFLDSSEDLCLEFWFYKPNPASSELRVFLSDEGLQTEIWTSLDSESHIWRQVYIPLSYSQLNVVQIIFELLQGQANGEQVVFDMIGIRRGQCGLQCQSDVQFWTDESTQCTCTAGQLTCSQSPCGDGQTCGQTLSSTALSTSATCRVASDLRFTTFDGVNFRFMGPCTYILTRVCEGINTLPDFVVEIQKKLRSNSSVSRIQQVNVNLQGLRVSLLRRDRRRVMVNGIWRNLPLSLYGNTVMVSVQGSVLELQTYFNLTVSYARSGSLQVTVPDQYSGKLCGMCGNFNKAMDNNSQLMEDVQALGLIWKAGDPPCEEPVKPSLCTEAEKLEYSSEAYCGILLSHPSPFSQCSTALGAKSFFQSCVFEMCSTRGDPETFCDVLQAFAKTCSEAGVPIFGWRNATYCPLVCGARRHFTSCSSQCPATCSRLDASEDCGSCEERCECDDGFLLSGGECVPAEDCGCWVDGEHYKKGQTFMEGKCERLCTCAGHGNIHCSATSCLAHEVCKMKEDVLGCFPPNPVTCSVYGDPHYITFDGKAYSIQGTCNYTIATTCTASPAPFTLTARNEGRNNSSSLNSVALSVDGLHLVIKKNKLVYVNGGHVTLPYSQSSSVKVFQKGQYVQVDTNIGLRFLFDGNSQLFVQVDERYQGITCGLCGTYSGIQFDDFLTPDGRVVPYPHDFASSWNTHDKDWMCSDGSPENPKCTPELNIEGFKECSKLFGDAFKACHWFVPPQIFVNSCVTDHCSSGGDQSQLCTSLQNYVAACEVSEVFLGEWWKDTVCANIPPPTTTGPTTSCSWSCTFDQNECGWEQLIQDSFDWTRWSGSTPTDFTGPTGDHTTGSGFYMYIESDGVHHGDSARMMSPVCDTLGTQCLSFWYHMYGWSTAMALNVYKLEEGQVTKIWSRVNNHGNNWHQAQIEIISRGPFQIIVEGIRGSEVTSDVAWDDVRITHGKCGDFNVNLRPDSPSPTSEDPTFLTSALVPKPVYTTFPQPAISNNHHPVCRMDCNFDNNFCTWDQLLTDVFDWTRHSGSTPTPRTGPSSDHTTGSGHYIYIEGDGVSHGDTARLLSEECSDRQPQCLEFWYHMYGYSWTMGLTVYLLHGNQAREIWKLRENQGNTWHRALVDFTPQDNFKIIFEGRRGHSEDSDVAVDDISLHRGRCQDLIRQRTAVHTPESSTLMTVDSTEQDTTLQSLQATVEPHESTKQLPETTAEDHKTTDRPVQTTVAPTAGSSNKYHPGGHYIYIEGDGVSHGDTARLLSEECSDRQPQCLEFWYHMYGYSWTMGLTVYLLHGNQAREIWKLRENQGNTWHRALVDFTPQDNFKIIFEGRRGHSEDSDVAVDDISLHRGRCQDLIRQRTAVRTPENSTIIAQFPDTTAENLQTTVGLIETTTQSHDTAAVDLQTTVELIGTTTQINDTTAVDLQTTVGLIETTTQSHDTAAVDLQTTVQLIETTTRIHDTTAVDLQTTVELIGTTTQIHDTTAVDIQTTVGLIETTTQSHDTTAVDLHTTVQLIEATTQLPGITTEVLQTTVEPLPTTGRPVQTTDASTTGGSNSYHPVCRMDCNFDNNFCTWDQLLTDVFDWTRQSGSTPTPKTGPSFDHTTGSGHYIYIEGDGVSHGDTARLLSEECSDRQPQCLEFWYHMYGSSWTMGLTVYLLHGNQAQEIWKLRENQGNTWHRALVDFTPRDNFKIIFEGRRGDDARSDVAVDDVSLHRGTCQGFINQVTAVPTLEGSTVDTTDSSTTTASQTTAETTIIECDSVGPPVETTATTDKPVQTTADLPSTTVEDLQTTGRPAQTTVDPTTGGSNIVHPVCKMDCNFDNNFCTWDQLLTDVFDWTRHTGPTPTPRTGPSADHTTGSGDYIYIEGDGVSHGDTARLLSEECSDRQPQCLEFWYHMYGSSWTMGLTVYLLHGNQAQEIWKLRENQGNTWHRALVDFTPRDNFKIIFEGRRGDDARSDVAVDDVSLHRGTCQGFINQVTAVPTLEGSTVDTTDSSTTTASQTTAETTIIECDSVGPPVETTATTDKPVQTTADLPSTTVEDLQTTGRPAQTTVDPTTGGSNIVHPVCKMDCNFDNNFCTWDQLLTDVFDWTRHTGSTPTPRTGPSSDHTTGSGHYIYIEGDGVSHGDTARLLSEECSDRQPQCLEFWYHMYGSSWTMGLTVYLLHGNQAQEIWKLRENQGNTWHRALVDFTPRDNFKIIFEGRRGDDARSDVAVDDISLHRGTCEDFKNQVTAVPTPESPTLETTDSSTTTTPITTEKNITIEVPSCPHNSHYTDCMPTCQPTCEQLHGPPNCNPQEACVQGCACDNGFILKQNVCVPIRECGCQDDEGNNHYFGEKWYSSHCTRKCECKEKDGQGELKCRNKQCDDDEVCMMSEEGKYSCKSADFSKCFIKNDPEYRTFDNMKYSFKGKRSYILVQTSELPKNIPEFNVMGINHKIREENGEEEYVNEEADGRERAADGDDDDDSSEEYDESTEEYHDDKGRLRALRIRVYNHTVELREGKSVIVDGVQANTPTFPSTGLKILEDSSRVYLKTDFGLTVEFKGKGKAEISLPDMYENKVGGLCGNFDDNKKNDMMKPNGEQAKNVKEFGESWRVVETNLLVRKRRSSLLYTISGLHQ